MQNQNQWGLSKGIQVLQVPKVHRGVWLLSLYLLLSCVYIYYLAEVSSMA